LQANDVTFCFFDELLDVELFARETSASSKGTGYILAADGQCIKIDRAMGFRFLF
jgi:hypothetical protein